MLTTHLQKCSFAQDCLRLLSNTVVLKPATQACRPLAACASRRSAAEAVYAPAMAQQLPFLLRGFACPNSDADPKDKAERAPDFHEIAHKKECGA